MKLKPLEQIIRYLIIISIFLTTSCLLNPNRILREEKNGQQKGENANKTHIDSLIEGIEEYPDYYFNLYPQHFLGLGIGEHQSAKVAAIISEAFARKDIARQIRVLLYSYMNHLLIECNDNLIYDEFNQITISVTGENLPISKIKYHELSRSGDSNGKLLIINIAILSYQDFFSDKMRLKDLNIDDFIRHCTQFKESRFLMKKGHN